MGQDDQQYGNIRATLAVSEDEARCGGSRVINLPGGRTATIAIPAGARNGQELRLTGQGLAASPDDPAGDVILRISIIANSSKNAPDNPALRRDDYASGRASSGGEQGAGWSNSPGWAPPAPNLAGGPPSYANPGGYQPPPSYGQPSQPPAPLPYSAGNAFEMAQPYLPTLAPNSPLPLNAGSPGLVPPSSARPAPKRRSLVTFLLLVCALVLLLGSGLAFYLSYVRLNQAHLPSARTANIPLTSTVSAAATSTAQIGQGTASADSTGTAQVAATEQGYQSVYSDATSGTPDLNDPLTVPSLTSLWDISVTTSDGSCGFTNGKYHSVIPKAGYFEPCYALGTNYSTFAFQVDMNIIQGDEGGIIFRANNDHSQYYLFRIDIDGSFDLYNYSGNNSSQAVDLLTGSSGNIKGLNQVNEITVVAQRTTMYFFINKISIGSSNDNTYSSGEIGVFAESMQKPTDVAFSNAKVWKI